MVFTLMRRQPRRTLLLLAGAVVAFAVLVSAHWTGTALATSSGDPYDVPLIVDTNPDPDIVETTIVTDEATVDVGNGVMANVQTFNGTVPGPEFRLKVGDTVIVILTDNAGVQIPLVRVGGQGGILDEAVVEGGVVGFDFQYGSGEILLDPGDRQDVVVAIPPTATGVLTLWTQDFDRTGTGFANIPTVPVAHFKVNGTAASTYSIGAGTDLLASNWTGGRDPRASDRHAARPDHVLAREAGAGEPGHPADPGRRQLTWHQRPPRLA